MLISRKQYYTYTHSTSNKYLFNWYNLQLFCFRSMIFYSQYIYWHLCRLIFYNMFFLSNNYCNVSSNNKTFIRKKYGTKQCIDIYKFQCFTNFLSRMSIFTPFSSNVPFYSIIHDLTTHNLPHKNFRNSAIPTENKE